MSVAVRESVLGVMRFAKWETARQLRSAKFRVMTVAIIALMAVALRLGLGDYNVRRDDYNAGLRQRQLDARQYKGMMFGVGVERALRAYRAPQPASVLVRGLDATRAAYWDFSPWGVVEGQAAPSLSGPSEVGTFPDVEALIRLAVGLLAMLLAIDSLAGAKDDGTYTAILAHPASRFVLVAGKGVGTILSVGVSLILISISLALLVRLWAADLPQWQILEVLIATVFVSLFYATTLVATGLLVGAICRRYATAFIVGLGLWAWIAFVSPQLVVYGAQLLTPRPAPAAAAASRQTALSAHMTETMNRGGDAYLRLSGEGRLRMDLDKLAAPRQELEQVWQASLPQHRAVLDDREREERGRIEARHRLLARLSWLSPGVLYLRALDDVAGTGRSTEQIDQVAVQAYQRQLEPLLFEDPPRLGLAVPSGDGRSVVAFDRHEPARVDDLPRIQLESHAFQSRISHAATELAGLFVYSVFLSVAAFVAVNRS